MIFIIVDDSYAIAKIFFLTFKNGYGNVVGKIICLGVIVIAIFFCGMSSVTSTQGWFMHSLEMELCHFHRFGIK